MSGHSKWATIRHQKGVKDARRGQLFTKLAKAITIAVREGSGADPESNFKLRLAVDTAKSANMPKDNIARAIENGVGKTDGLSEATYEGFGPGGVAVLVKTFTDNTNRTVSELRKIFGDTGGSLAGPGSVAHLFKPIGMIRAKSKDNDTLELAAIDLGALETEQTPEELLVSCNPTDLHKLQEGLERSGGVIEDANLTQQPYTYIKVADPEIRTKITEFIDNLEVHDDVVEVWTNADLGDTAEGDTL